MQILKPRYSKGNVIKETEKYLLHVFIYLFLALNQYLF